MRKFLLVLAMVVFGFTSAFAANNACYPGTACTDGSMAIADIDTGATVEVSSTGNMSVVSSSAMTLVRKESSQALGTGALAYTTNFAAKTKVKAIMFHAASAITQTVTFTLDSKTNATYDTVLASEDLVAESNYTYFPGDLVLESGDELLISCTNSGTPAITVYVTVLGSTIL